MYMNTYRRKKINLWLLILIILVIPSFIFLISPALSKSSGIFVMLFALSQHFCTLDKTWFIAFITLLSYASSYLILFSSQKRYFSFSSEVFGVSIILQTVVGFLGFLSSPRLSLAVGNL